MCVYIYTHTYIYLSWNLNKPQPVVTYAAATITVTAVTTQHSFLLMRLLHFVASLTEGRGVLGISFYFWCLNWNVIIFKRDGRFHESVPTVDEDRGGDDGVQQVQAAVWVQASSPGCPLPSGSGLWAWVTGLHRAWHPRTSQSNAQCPVSSKGQLFIMTYSITLPHLLLDTEMCVIPKITFSTRMWSYETVWVWVDKQDAA